MIPAECCIAITAADPWADYEAGRRGMEAAAAALLADGDAPQVHEDYLRISAVCGCLKPSLLLLILSTTLQRPRHAAYRAGDVSRARPGADPGREPRYIYIYQLPVC